MKTLILYATKHGAAAEIAQRIAEDIDGAVIQNIKKEAPSLADFECIIIGSSVYAGSIRKEAKEFLIKNKNALLEKKLGLFISGIGQKGEKKYFNDNFPQEILYKAEAAVFLGGIFNPKEAGAFERFIIRLITGNSGYINSIDDDKIIEFTKKIKA